VETSDGVIYEFINSIPEHSVVYVRTTDRRLAADVFAQLSVIEEAKPMRMQFQDCAMETQPVVSVTIYGDGWRYQAC